MKHRLFWVFNAAILVLPALLGGCGGGGSGSSSSQSPTTTPQPTPIVTVNRVACVGDSITAGAGVSNPSTQAYPAVLGRALGRGYEVRNFGVSGATLLSDRGAPYRLQGNYTEALRFKPDTLTVALGTNDSRFSFDSATQNQFLRDYKDLIGAFRAANPQVKVYVCLPVPSYPMIGNMNLTLAGQISPLIRRVARDEGAQIIDLYTPLSNKPLLFPDGLHPNAAGAAVIAQEINRALINP
jgi:sialate O-acetylesterase